MPIKSGAICPRGSDVLLHKAILVYQGTGGGYSTIHDIIGEENGRPLIGAGVPATKSALGELAKGLIKGVKIGGFLPENVLSVGIDSIVWWVKPSKSRQVWFKARNEKLGERSGKTPHPALVFKVSGKNWSVWAVKGKDRPTPDTVLYQAPYLNVYDDGRICTGNVSVPSQGVTETIAAWEDAFFNSYFTHPNSMRMVKSKGGGYQFWIDMLDGKFKSFPSSVLVATETKLDDIVG